MTECATANKLENEQEIVERAKNDDQAFAVLYDFYFPKIYRYVYSRVGSQPAAEDLVSQVFLKVFTNLKSYKYQGYSFGAWVYKIATNILIDYYRKESRKKEVILDEAVELAAADPLPGEEIDRRKQRDKIMLILKQLPPPHQHILHLRFFADLSHEEVAAAMAISVNNARVATYRALKQFKKIYDRVS